MWAALSLTAFAQSDNTQISGFVKDQAGAVIAGAKVTAKNETNGLERSATSNGEGYYVITQLPSGFYTVLAQPRYVRKKLGQFVDANNHLGNGIAIIGIDSNDAREITARQCY